jgi:hypothetical protein
MREQKNLTDFRAWRVGADLALKLLEGADSDTMCLDVDPPQHNLMLRYLLSLREIDDARVDAAFCAVLTDYIASTEHAGVVPGVSFLRQLSRKPIATMS